MNNTTWIEIIFWGAIIVSGTLFLLHTLQFLVGGEVAIISKSSPQ